VNDALRNVLGVTILNLLRHNGGTFANIRGFTNDGDSYFLNGRRSPSSFLPPSTSSLEQVEVLKAPASILPDYRPDGKTKNWIGTHDFLFGVEWLHDDLIFPFEKLKSFYTT
jgi:outer membrane receptor for monomeric catechols